MESSHWFPILVESSSEIELVLDVTQPRSSWDFKSKFDSFELCLWNVEHNQILGLSLNLVLFLQQS